VTLLALRVLGDPVLRAETRPVTAITDDLRTLIADLFETMHAARGIGLAAPQVGIGKRIIVVHVGEDGGPYAVINPVLTDFDGEETAAEGCLSIPGKVGDVVRALRCTVAGLDRKGKKLTLTAEGLLARCFQHEVDHLDGVLITDKATNIRDAVPVEAAQAAAESP